MYNTRRTINICFLLLKKCVVGIFACLTTTASTFTHGADIPYSPVHSENIVYVGVRQQAEPFSYVSSRRSDSSVLTGYSGYMVEICRRVLNEILSEGYFQKYRVVAVDVNASNRFTKLDTGQVDLLCGPDSITQTRLVKYNASHPVFLSGVALVSKPDEDFPRKRYCKGIVGMVAGTTATESGLEQMIEMENIRRFKPALLSFLSQYSQNKAPQSRTSFSVILSEWKKSHVAQESPLENQSNGYNPVPSRDVKVSECPSGFDTGPVIFYDNHQLGVEAFCNGETLFYLGDIDLLNYKFNARPTCEKIFDNRTLTREAYGIYFRKVANVPNQKLSRREIDDVVLYARFNNILLRKMQDSESILAYEYKQQFGDKKQAADLVQFFESFQYANKY